MKRLSDDIVPMTLADCPVRTVLDVLQGKWKPLILFFLKPGMRRYGELRAYLPGAREKVLIQQLRELERDQIVERTAYPSKLPRVEYRLSAYGKTLIAVLQQMADWGELHRVRLAFPQETARPKSIKSA